MGAWWSSKETLKLITIVEIEIQKLEKQLKKKQNSKKERGKKELIKIQKTLEKIIAKITGLHKDEVSIDINPDTGATDYLIFLTDSKVAEKAQKVLKAANICQNVNMRLLENSENRSKKFQLYERVQIKDTNVKDIDTSGGYILTGTMNVGILKQNTIKKRKEIIAEKGKSFAEAKAKAVAEKKRIAAEAKTEKKRIAAEAKAEKERIAAQAKAKNEKSAAVETKEKVKAKQKKLLSDAIAAAEAKKEKLIAKEKAAEAKKHRLEKRLKKRKSKKKKKDLTEAHKFYEKL